MGERIDKDYQLAQDFKDELIPMAYEYYLNVVDHNYPSSEDEDSSGDDSDTGLDKFDEEGNPIDKKA